VIDKFELASAMAFDLGVFLVVIGTVLLALSQLSDLRRNEAMRTIQRDGEG
jgi:multicomponent K+:H+ antiporter subunit A